jgi:hypothetical protein
MLDCVILAEKAKQGSMSVQTHAREWCLDALHLSSYSSTLPVWVCACGCLPRSPTHRVCAVQIATKLLGASMDGDSKVVGRLLDKGASVNTQSKVRAREAVSIGRDHVVSCCRDVPYQDNTSGTSRRDLSHRLVSSRQRVLILS